MIEQRHLEEITSTFAMQKGGRHRIYFIISKELDCSYEYVLSVLTGRREVSSKLSKKIVERAAQIADRLIQGKKITSKQIIKNLKV